MTLRFLSQEDPSELLRRLPACYGAEFDACVDEFNAAEAEKREPKLSPYCQKYYADWKNTPSAIWEAAVESVPFCSAPPEKQKNFPLWLLGAGFAGLILGTLIR